MGFTYFVYIFIKINMRGQLSEPNRDHLIAIFFHSISLAPPLVLAVRGLHSLNRMQMSFYAEFHFAIVLSI